VNMQERGGAALEESVPRRFRRPILEIALSSRHQAVVSVILTCLVAIDPVLDALVPQSKEHPTPELACVA
jgi:hypothetical protein